MIYQAAEIVKHFLTDLPFVEKLGGLVKTYEKQDPNGNTVRYPVAYNLTETECNAGKYLDFVPDGKFKSSIYFEGDRARITRTSGKIHVEADLKLVCWMNLKKMGVNLPYSHYAITQIAQAIPTRMFNYTPDGIETPQYQRVQISLDSTEYENIFSRYTYDKRVLFFPYDYFSININVKFEINYECYDIPTGEEGSC
jgi:hypothetical protein